MKLNMTRAGIVSPHWLSYTDRARFCSELETEVPDLCKLKRCASRADED
jgi:hypothetical protein